MNETERMKGWRFLLLNVAAGAANVVMLSNVPGYTVLAPYAAGSLEGVTPSYAGDVEGEKKESQDQYYGANGKAE